MRNETRGMSAGVPSVRGRTDEQSAFSTRGRSQEIPVRSAQRAQTDSDSASVVLEQSPGSVRSDESNPYLVSTSARPALQLQRERTDANQGVTGVQ